MFARDHALDQTRRLGVSAYLYSKAGKMHLLKLPPADSSIDPVNDEAHGVYDDVRAGADAFYLSYIPGGQFAGTYTVLEAGRTGSCANLLAAPGCSAGDKLSYASAVCAPF